MSITIVSDPINNYTEIYTDPELDILRELALETRAVVPGAQMLTGHLAGTFLQMISKILQPRLILELGTYTGYSAICLAQGLHPEGKIITIDTDERWNEMRQRFWQKAGVADKIDFKAGAAAEAIPHLEDSPDLVFIDADKKNYWNYLQLLIPKMKTGGIILADNVLFSGEVTLPEDLQQGATAHIHSFNKQTLEETRIEKIMLPIRDGISVFRIK